MRLLIVEDSQRLRDYLAEGLTAVGYAVDSARDGRQGLIHARTTEYDAIILDLMLPELDGLSLLEQLRQAGGTTPVLVVSARDRVDQRVEGLRKGADDYLVKPFEFDELLARVEALTRRSRGVATNQLTISGVTLDLAGRRFLAGARELELAPREYAVLEYLFLSTGRVVSRAELEEHVYPEDRQVWSNAIDSAISAIRRRLSACGVEGLVQTRRGRGYVVSAPQDTAGAAG